MLIDEVDVRRDRERRRLRSQLAEAALQLTTERGYAGVTVDDIAWAAGVSRRSFFRAFPTKRDALMFWSDDLHDFALRRARFAFAGPGLVWDDLRLVCVMLTRDCLGAPERTKMMHRLTVETDELRAYGLDRHEAFCGTLIELARAKEPGPVAVLAVRCAMAIGSAGFTWWAGTDSLNANHLIRAMVDDFDRLAAVFAPRRDARDVAAQYMPSSRKSATATA